MSQYEKDRHQSAVITGQNKHLALEEGRGQVARRTCLGYRFEIVNGYEERVPCGKVFISLSPGNRFCEECTHRQNWCEEAIPKQSRTLNKVSP